MLSRYPRYRSEPGVDVKMPLLKEGDKLLLVKDGESAASIMRSFFESGSLSSFKVYATTLSFASTVKTLSCPITCMDVRLNPWPSELL